MVRFALLAPQFGRPTTGGVGPHARKLGEALLDLGDDVLIFSEGELGSVETALAVQTVGPKWTIRAALRAFKAMTRRKCDVLLIEYTPFNFGPRTLAPMLVAALSRVAGIRTVTYVHEIFYQAGSPAVSSPIKAQMLAFRDRLMLFLSERIYVASVAKAKRIRQCASFVNPASIEVLPIGANIEPHHGDEWSESAADTSTIMSFGVVMPRRRFELIIMALAQLVRAGYDIKARFVGSIYDRSYAERCLALAREEGILDRVAFTGALEDADVTAEFKRAGIYAYALEDGLISSSGSLLAALAHGVPIVASRTPADETIFEACTLSSDESHLANAMASLLNDMTKRSTIAKSARAIYAEQYDWRNIALRLRQRFQ